MEHTENHTTSKSSRRRGVFIETVRDMLLRAVELAYEKLEIMRREASLFFGLALFFVGVFGFRAGRFCDGNAADYLSCTRPAVYYYYGVFELGIIVIGASLIALWFLKPRRK